MMVNVKKSKKTINFKRKTTRACMALVVINHQRISSSLATTPGHFFLHTVVEIVLNRTYESLGLFSFFVKAFPSVRTDSTKIYVEGKQRSSEPDRNKARALPVWFGDRDDSFCVLLLLHKII